MKLRAPKVDRPAARVHLNVRLDVELIESIDELAERLKVTRSEAIRLALADGLRVRVDGRLK